MYAAQEEHTDQCRRLAKQLLVAGKTHQNGDDNGKPADAGEEETGIGRQLQRHMAKAGDGIEGKTHHLAQRIFRFAGIARRTLVLDGDLLETDPTAQPTHKAALFAQPAHRQNHSAVHQAEVTGVERDVHIGDIADQAVEGRRRPQLEFCLTLALGAHCIGDIVPFAPLFDHAQQHLGRILQIGVHHDHSIAIGIVKTGRNCDLMAEVTAEVEHLDAIIAHIQFRQHVDAAVRTAVVDEDHFPALARAFHHLHDAFVEHGNHSFFIPDRNDKRENWAHMCLGMIHG